MPLRAAPHQLESPQSPAPSAETKTSGNLSRAAAPELTEFPGRTAFDRISTRISMQDPENDCAKVDPLVTWDLKNVLRAQPVFCQERETWSHPDPRAQPPPSLCSTCLNRSRCHTDVLDRTGTCGIPTNPYRPQADFPSRPACGNGSPVMWLMPCHLQRENHETSLQTKKMCVQILAPPPPRPPLVGPTCECPSIIRPSTGTTCTAGQPKPTAFMKKQQRRAMAHFSPTAA